MAPAPGKSRRWRFRSIVVRVVVFLLLGAVVNVAVAWGCAYWCTIETGPKRSDFLGYGSESLSEGEYTWYTMTNANHTSRLVYSFVLPKNYKGNGTREFRDEFEHGLPRTPPPPWATASQTIDIHGGLAGFARGTGWPALCAYTTFRYVGDTRKLSLQVVDHSAIVLETSLGLESLPRSLPLHPIWPGFVINTLFYTSVLWLLFAAPFTLRRWRRVRRGLCARCAYPVGTNAVCTECGASRPGVVGRASLRCASGRG